MNACFIDVVFHVWYIFVKGGDDLINAGERVRLVREHFGLTMAEFGSKFGVTRASISNIENGNRGLTNQMLSSICKEFDVSEEWLKDGIGGDEIVFNRTANDAAANFAKDNNLDKTEEVLIREYLKLSDGERAIFRKYLKNVLSELNGMTTASDLKKKEIDQKVEAYREELEIEAASEKSKVLPTGSEGMADEA